MRPKGVKNPYKPKMVIGIEDRIYTINDLHRTYEVALDAMLEGLEKGDHFMRVTDKAVTMPGFEATVDDTVRGAGDGLWVFIPEGKG